MSAKLQLAFNANKVTVKKLVSGEVILKFHSMHQLPDLLISGDREINLLSRKGVTVDVLKKSNLKELVSSNYLELV